MVKVQTTNQVQANGQGSTGSEAGIRTRMRAVMAGLWPREPANDRRKNQRCVYPYLVQLVPVDETTLEPQGESLVVVGKNLSEEGFDFYHCQSLPHRWMIATFDQPKGSEVSLLLELSWCRFNKQGWYDSGGRFRRLVPTPASDEDEAGPQTRSA